MIDPKSVPGFGEGGWFWLSQEGNDLSRALAQQLDQEAQEVVDAFRATFTTGPGRKVLADLIARTLNQPTWVPGVVDPVMAGFAREGQNSIVRYILERMQSGGAIEDFKPQPDFSGVTDNAQATAAGSGPAGPGQPAAAEPATVTERPQLGTPAGDRPSRRRKPVGKLGSILAGTHTPGPDDGGPGRPKGRKRRK